MAKKPTRYRPVGTVWAPEPEKKGPPAFVWIIGVFALLACLSQCA